MEINIEDFKPTSDDHVLKKMWETEYGLGFKNLISNYVKLVDSKKGLNNLMGKLFLKQSTLDTSQKNQYIQTASEVTVVNYFATNYPEFFVLEPKLTGQNNNDVECQFQFNGLKFNVEVKSSSYILDKKKSDSNFQLQIKGHLNEYKELFESMKTVLPNTELEKRFDNNFKSHLCSAQSKLPVDNNINHCNVLILACNDSEDIQNHYDYLFATEGFFTSNSFLSHSEFNLVDIVFLTNLFFKHNSDIENPKLDNQSWQFEKSFIVGFRNPFRKDTKNEHLNLIEATVPNYTRSFKEYTGGPEFIRLRHFIHTELGDSRKIYHY
jgi:hypothetical protein